MFSYPFTREGQENEQKQQSTTNTGRVHRSSYQLLSGLALLLYLYFQEVQPGPINTSKLSPAELQAKLLHLVCCLSGGRSGNLQLIKLITLETFFFNT